MSKIHAIGLAFAMMMGLILVSNLSHAGQQLGTGTPNTPQHYGDGSVSLCNDDGTFCFHIELPGMPAQPGCPSWDHSCGPGLPLEVWGEDAQLIIERGRIMDRYRDWTG